MRQILFFCLFIACYLHVTVNSFSISSTFAKFSKRLLDSSKNQNNNEDLEHFVNETTHIISKTEDLFHRIVQYRQLKKENVLTEKAPRPIGPYSQAIKKNGIVYLSGCIGIDPSTGKLISDDIKEQTVQALANMQAILAESKSNWNSVLKVTIYTTDLKSFATINEVYSGILKDNSVAVFPARTTVEISALPLGAKFEIDAVASYDE